MITTTIVLFGLPITLRYQVHPAQYIEWWLDVDVDEMSAHDELLEYSDDGPVPLNPL